MTPLDLSKQMGNTPANQVLAQEMDKKRFLKKSNDLYPKTADGATPTKLAKRHGHEEIATLLKRFDPKDVATTSPLTRPSPHASTTTTPADLKTLLQGPHSAKKRASERVFFEPRKTRTSAPHAHP